MTRPVPLAARRALAVLKRASDAVAGVSAVALLKGVRQADPDRAADFAGSLLRRVGPWFPEHRVGRENLAAAFPQKSRAEHDRILAGAWDNLGRLAAEYAHMDRLWDYDPRTPGAGRIEPAPGSLERFVELREDGKPALIFAAHLANWELPALAAAAHGMHSAVLYRRPNQLAVADAIRNIRAGQMGELIPTGPAALPQVARALEAGSHVGMLVDQHFSRGVDVLFFGRRCKVNPTVARLLQHFDCPLHGARVIRLPERRFRLELTERIPVARSAEGRVDIQRTMQAVTTVVEQWVREYPEQWLWMHRRWR